MLFFSYVINIVPITINIIDISLIIVIFSFKKIINQYKSDNNTSFIYWETLLISASCRALKYENHNRVVVIPDIIKNIDVL